jgi:hypothetical protein
VRVSVLLGLAPLAFAAPSAAAGQGVSFELRAGAVVSTAMAEDAVANASLARRLGAGFEGPVRAEPATGLIVEAAVRTGLRSRTLLELSAGWTFTRLDAIDASGRRTMQGLGVAHALIGVRYRVVSRLEGGCGFGAARYTAERRGLFAAGAELAPAIECSAGAATPSSSRRLVLRASVQAHRFRTPILRDAGAQAGTVLRYMVVAGVGVGPRR